MQIDSSILQSWFKKICLTNKIPTIKLVDSGIDGIQTKLSLLNQVRVYGWLSDKVFHKYEPLTLEIRDSTKFDKLLKSFKGKMNISIDGIFVKMWNDNKTVYFKRANEIENYNEGQIKLEYDRGIDLPLSFINEILTNIANCDAEIVNFYIKDDNYLVVETIGNEDNIKEQINVQYKPIKFTMSAEYFKTIFSSLENDKINVSFIELKDKTPPIKITDKGETYKVEVWCAPFNPE